MIICCEEYKMKQQQDMKSIVKFIHLNIDFFAAPFAATDSTFQDWAKTNDDMIRFSNELSDAFDESLNRKGRQPDASVFYREKLKLYGSYRISIQQLAKGKEMNHLANFLFQNPSVVRAFKNNINNPCIAAWYETQATSLQKAGRDSRVLAWGKIVLHSPQESEFNKNQVKKYYKASESYAIYLHEVIDDEIAHLNNHALEDLADELGMKNISNKKLISKELCKKIINPTIISQEKDKLLNLIRGKSNLQDALAKYEVIKQAQAGLEKKDESNDVKINNFEEHLRNSQRLLTQRRDSGFMTFLKGLGVASASIFGLGVGGFLAYQHLFGSKATEGHRYLKETAKIQATPKPKSRP